MYRIFIVEDDQVMASTIREQMKAWGNDAVVVSDFKNVVAEFVEYDPHLVLMDVMLPFFNGYHWCTEIRKISNVPVMFLSSASDRVRIVHNFLWCTDSHHFSSMLSCSRTNVHQTIRSQHGILVMLHHNQCVTQIPQSLERCQ